LFDLNLTKSKEGEPGEFSKKNYLIVDTFATFDNHLSVLSYFRYLSKESTTKRFDGTSGTIRIYGD